MNLSTSRVVLYLFLAGSGFLLHRTLLDDSSGLRSDETESPAAESRVATDGSQRSVGHDETWEFLLDQQAPDQNQLRNLLAHWARVAPLKAMAALNRDFLLIDEPDHCLSMLLREAPLDEAENVIDALLKAPRLRHAALARRDSSWRGGVEQLLGDLTRADAERAWNLARSLPPGGMRGYLSGIVVAALPKQDFPRITALAIMWLGESPLGEDRERLIEALVNQGSRYFDSEEFAAWKMTIHESLPKHLTD